MSPTAPYHTTAAGHRLAYHATTGTGPCFIWCGGLKSDMEGGKAVHLERWAAALGRNYVRFDYFGHGISDGEFIDGTISRWRDDIIEMIDHIAPQGDVILVGSSMGGWASLLSAVMRPARIKGLVLINPAPDFTQKLTYASWDAAKRQALIDQGVVYEPSDYGEPYAYSRALMDDGRDHQILDAPIEFDGAVRILQGASDSVVPWAYSRQILDVITSDDATYTLVKDGDHSLSRPADLDRLIKTVEDIALTVDGRDV